MTKETNKKGAVVVISKKWNLRQEVMEKSQYLMIKGDMYNVCDESLYTK